jgi:leucyl-tRNA synthetase
VLLAPWPQYREDAIVEEEVLIVVQVNGKLRSRFWVATDTNEETIEESALTDKRILKFISGKTIKKVIVVKNKLVNIVV